MDIVAEGAGDDNRGPGAIRGVGAMSVCSPVAVIGAGNVGCALAADLGLRGVKVRLFNRSPGRLAAIRDAGGISVTGETEGLAAPVLLTGSLEEAIDGAEVVAVTVPTASLPAYGPRSPRRRPISS